MPRGPSEAIISIHPRHAEAILRGDKTVELRRRIPLIAPGTKLWIYATLPVGAVIGTASVSRIERGSPTSIWNTWKQHACITRAEYRNYFSGSSEAIALILSNPSRIGAVPMDALRQMRQGFHPPQVMAQLSATESESLKALSKAA